MVQLIDGNWLMMLMKLQLRPSSVEGQTVAAPPDAQMEQVMMRKREKTVELVVQMVRMMQMLMP